MRMLTIRVTIVAAAVALLAAGYGLTSAGNHNDADDDFVAAKIKPVPPAAFPCARFAPGSIVQNPPDLSVQRASSWSTCPTKQFHRNGDRFSVS